MNIQRNSFAVLPTNLNRSVMKTNIQKQNNFNIDEKNDFKDMLLLMIKLSNEKKIMKALGNIDAKIPKSDTEPSMNKNNDNNKESCQTDSEKKMDTHSMNSTNDDLNAEELEAISIKLTAKILGINEKEIFF
ncbi:hypothetical protein ACFFHH_13155 [Cytobacillus solani]|uniref:Uncharacterized protein n=1 Tax=Cytobacillus solani TaxID=1637975 RepID=A0A0Q3SN32_9BACI|nr:hypothetical protein [Cytobacillus solani]KOP84091.1 hypothetical protein AMS60_00080 [Bacillus sp. FJAT-21945]KQL21020.1 hypothetical protein AN957_22235 [Cytobacillus solani]USK54268.1 hypothetical protein LIS82_22360 [Cytobacillus solani]